jgi:hypothetical protein
MATDLGLVLAVAGVLAFTVRLGVFVVHGPRCPRCRRPGVGEAREIADAPHFSSSWCTAAWSATGSSGGAPSATRRDEPQATTGTCSSPQACAEKGSPRAMNAYGVSSAGPAPPPAEGRPAGGLPITPAATEASRRCHHVAVPPAWARRVDFFRVAQVTKRYAKAAALDHVTVTIEPGEFVAVIGRSGAGKTTLLRCLGGAVPVSASELEWRAAQARRHRVASAVAPRASEDRAACPPPSAGIRVAKAQRSRTREPELHAHAAQRSPRAPESRPRLVTPSGGTMESRQAEVTSGFEGPHPEVPRHCQCLVVPLHGRGGGSS